MRAARYCKGPAAGAGVLALVIRLWIKEEQPWRTLEAMIDRLDDDEDDEDGSYSSHRDGEDSTTKTC